MPPKTRSNWHKAFDTQMALYGWYLTPLARDWMQESFRINTSGIENEQTKDLSRDLYSNEIGRLIDCDPIFVSADMCELIEFATDTFKPEPLLETDLITPRAFLYYERPFRIPDRFENPVEIQAVSWTRMFSSVSNRVADTIKEALRQSDANITLDEETLRITTGNSEIVENLLTEHGADTRGIALTIYAQTEVDKMHGEYRLYEYPPVLPVHLTPWYFGMTFEGNEVDLAGVPTGAIWWWSIVQTTMRMMQQRISVKHHHRPDRAGRREMQRHGYRPDTETVVVRLRGEEAERKDPSGESANYSHRFIRRGHWRDQWYPTIQSHRQIWIDPTIVGPSDLPLIVKPRRAFQWNR